MSSCIALVLMGPPGAGKGTQGEKLASHFGIPHIASGDLLRRILVEEADSELGRAAQIISEGRMVSNELAGRIVFRELGKVDGFILDGFPRNTEQADLLRTYLAARGQSLTCAIYLHVDEAVILERLSGRLTCINCGSTYNVRTEPPKVAGICDKCGHLLEVRPDDQADRVRVRLQLYQERTAPLINWYKEVGLLRTIDAAGEELEVFARCVAAIGA